MEWRGRKNPGRFSLKAERELTQLAASGKSVDAIARAMKRPPETIRKVARRLGVSLKAKAK
jgi:DNA-binding NarL/FixJ family response regulator